MPGGRSSAGSPASSPSRSTVSIRRSTSRTASRYSSTCTRSARPELARQAREIGADEVENAAILARLCRALRIRAAVAEQALEHDSRIVLTRDRSRRRAPRQRVQVDAAVRAVAHAGEHAEVDRKLERRQHGLLAEHLRRQLIGRHAAFDVGAFGTFAAHAGQPSRIGFRVIARGAVLGVGLGHSLVDAADDGQAIAVWRKRRENRRELRLACPRLSASSSRCP